MLPCFAIHPGLNLLHMDFVFKNSFLDLKDVCNIKYYKLRTQIQDARQTYIPIYYLFFFSPNFNKCLFFSANDAVSLFGTPSNNQGFVASPFVAGKSAGKHKLVRHSVLNLFKNSDPKVTSCVCGLKTSLFINSFLVRI